MCLTVIRFTIKTETESYDDNDTGKNVGIIQKLTRMWANAKRDGRPAEYRWRPLFNAAKFG